MSSLGLGVAGLAIAGAGLAESTISSVSQAHKVNELQKSLKDPTYNIPPEFYQNREIARQIAQQGLPQQVINDQTNQINQRQAAAIAANPRNTTSIVRQGNQADAKLAAEDAQARDNNQRYFIQQNSQLGGQELAKQQSDVFDKYTRDFNEMQAYRGASMQNLNNAATGAEQLGMTALNYKTNNPSSPYAKPTPNPANQLVGLPDYDINAPNSTFFGNPQQYQLTQ